MRRLSFRGVVITKATSLAHARLLAALNEFSGAALFVEGYSMMAGGASIPNRFDTETK